MHVARLAATDVARYRALMLHAYEVADDAFTSTPEERAAEPESWWIKRIADPDCLSASFGAFHDDALIGTVTVEFSAKPKTRHKAHLIGMFVVEAARGLGAGKALLRAAVGAASARPGTLVVTLTVTEGNRSAIRLYESCGFRTFGVEPMAIATRDGFKSKVHMWLQLPAAQEACMFKRIDHIELLTAAPGRTIAFYIDVLGFRERERARIPETPLGPLDLVYLELGGTTVEVMCYPESNAFLPRSPEPRLGWQCLALEVQDMEAALRALEQQGVAVAWGPLKRPEYARAEIRDPDGNPIELRQWYRRGE